MKIVFAVLAALGLYFAVSSVSHKPGDVTTKTWDGGMPPPQFPTTWDGGTPPPVFPH